MFMIVPTGRGEDIMDELIPIDLYDEILEWHYEIEKMTTNSSPDLPVHPIITESCAKRPKKKTAHLSAAT